ncbi:hypothetical protein [Hansschlegelia plantiphila]|uniref:Uncharacterized protein n=1 Tax=Hansschlegelia plantiphila TaxID=374655 RepID=A0A9W6MUR4_9HYPH|nr:hypothetical protein [Hansschlegelia plantiphila]GLK67659.1 hypothetical protein GCM10008179_12970 [Hansschlegelia plantiphila]
MANGSGDVWLLMTVIGVIILGGALAYAMVRNRGMTRRQKEVSENATEDLYARENADPANRD